MHKACSPVARLYLEELKNRVAATLKGYSELVLFNPPTCFNVAIGSVNACDYND